MTRIKTPKFSSSDVDRFLKLQTQIQELLARMAAISNKTPDLAVNKFKLGMINEQLRIANEILTGASRPFESFEIFDDVSLPTNSDVTIVLSQYLACLEKWRCDHVEYDESQYRWVWSTDDDSLIKTDPPSNRGEGGR